MFDLVCTICDFAPLCCILVSIGYGSVVRTAMSINLRTYSDRMNLLAPLQATAHFFHFND